MLNIIVVEDNSVKRDKILTLISSSINIPESNIVFACDVKSAKRLIYKNPYDLMILDLVLPVDEDDEPSPKNGINFLSDIHSNPQVKPITHIVGLTGFSEHFKTYRNDFENRLWQLIDYKAEEVDWKEKLKNILFHLIKVRTEFLQRENLDYDYDIAIITALQDPELDQVLALDANWEEFKYGNDATLYYKGIFKNDSKTFRVVATSSPQMGMVASSTLSMKIIHNFRPRYLFMTGIAAGVKGEVNFGDILIADQTYDGTNGKITTTEAGDKGFNPNPTPIALDSDLKEKVRTYESKSKYFFKLKNKWQGNKPTTDLKIKIGPVVSVPYVIENEEELVRLKEHQRKLIGLEMETFGVFYSANNGFNPKPRAMAFKSVCDFGDKDKVDDFQKYAAFTSAQFMYDFVLNEL
jgi:nucleoside phosphorylase/CheY-like chemotaxis protein